MKHPADISHRRRNAFLVSRLPGSTFGHRRATQTHRNRKHDARMGLVKHRGRALADHVDSQGRLA